MVRQTSALTISSQTGADCLLEGFPQPFLTVEVDIARTQFILDLTGHKVSRHMVIFFPHGGQILFTTVCCPATVKHGYSLGGKGCRAMCSCYAQMDSSWIPCQKSAMNLTCQKAKPSGKPSRSLASLQSKPSRPDMTTVVCKVVFLSSFQKPVQCLTNLHNNTLLSHDGAPKFLLTRGNNCFLSHSPLHLFCQ